MGITRGANIVQDDLVFGYDTGYGVADNATSTRFYPGEPTTNLYTNSDFNSEIGWTFSSWHNNAVTHTSVSNVIGRDGRTCKAEKLYIGASSSASHFHQFNNGKYTSGNTYTTSAWVKGSGTFAIKSHWGGNTNFTMTGEWQRVSMTVTATSSSSSHFPYFAGEGLTVGSDFYITDAQTELKSHATPYVYSGGNSSSRSNTASLIDLKRTTDITLANVSFDSTGQPEFDGTDDKINGPNFNLEAMVDSTLEAVIYMDDLGGTHNSYSIFGGVATGNRHGYHEIRNSGSGWKMTHWTSSNGWRYANTALSAGKYYHVVWVWNGLKLYWYLNGVADGDYTYTTFSPYSLGFTTIGSFGTERYMDGKIPVAKLYKKGLSAEEVKQNFNAYKNRFNI